MIANKRNLVLLISFLSMSFFSGSCDLRDLINPYLEAKKNNPFGFGNKDLFNYLSDELWLDPVDRIKYGISGTTVATSEGRELVIKGNHPYKCTGTISDSDGSCSGDLEKLSFDDKKDVCLSKPKLSIPNWYCFSISSKAKLVNSKGEASCSAEDGEPTVLVSTSEYNSMCDAIVKATTYKFFTPWTVPEVKGVSCTGSDPIVCTYPQ